MIFHALSPKDVAADARFEILMQAMDGKHEIRRRKRTLPAEWAPQSAIQLTWPHSGTDWAPMLPEVTECYLKMAFEMASRQPLLIVTPEPENLQQLQEQRLPANVLENICIVKAETDDTWARDHGFITVEDTDGWHLLDFRFNGWGGKFEAQHDNAINAELYRQGVLQGHYDNCLDFELEGGSIESDGAGTILTTAECLLNPNRRQAESHQVYLDGRGAKEEDEVNRRQAESHQAYLNGRGAKEEDVVKEEGEANRRHAGDAVPQVDKAAVERILQERLGAQRILWLHHGYLAGDDTDSHIDTLARLCPDDTILYVRCDDSNDEHYPELKAMEAELTALRTAEGKPFRLIPLPMAKPCVENGERLPATYANFLVMNTAVLVPTYAQENDGLALRKVAEAFPGRDVVGIDCRPLIVQHGSLHCCTMQYPRGVYRIPHTK